MLRSSRATELNYKIQTLGGNDAKVFLYLVRIVRVFRSFKYPAKRTHNSGYQKEKNKKQRIHHQKKLELNVAAFPRTPQTSNGDLYIY